MRERLAVGRARSDMLLAGAEAFGDELGALASRAVDNGDRQARRRFKWIMAHSVAQIGMIKANAVAHEVLRHLEEQKCKGCKGLGVTVSGTGVYAACLACNATGRDQAVPSWWTEVHRALWREALGAMGRHFRRTRAQVVDNPQ